MKYVITKNQLLILRNNFITIDNLKLSNFTPPLEIKEGWAGREIKLKHYENLAVPFTQMSSPNCSKRLTMGVDTG